MTGPTIAPTRSHLRIGKGGLLQQAWQMVTASLLALQCRTFGFTRHWSVPWAMTATGRFVRFPFVANGWKVHVANVDLNTKKRQKRSRTLQKRQDQMGHPFGGFPMDVVAVVGKRNELRADDRIFHLDLMLLSRDHVLLSRRMRAPRRYPARAATDHRQAAHNRSNARFVTAPRRFYGAHGRENSRRSVLRQNTIPG